MPRPVFWARMVKFWLFLPWFDLWWPLVTRKSHDIHIFWISRKNAIQWCVFHLDLGVFPLKSQFRSILTLFDPNLTFDDLGKVMIYTFSEPAEKMLSNYVYMKGYLTPTKSFSKDFSDINGQKTLLTSINPIVP